MEGHALRRARAATLAKALEAVLDGGAAEAAARIRAEDGVGAACDALEKTLAEADAA